MTAQTGRWQARPVEATLVRLVAFAIPFVAGLAASTAFVEMVGRPASLSVWVWRALVIGVATGMALAVDPIARRLLPLAALLRMSLLFPGRAPSRLALGLGSRQNTDLQELLATDLSAHTPDEAAEHVLRLVAALSHHDRITRGHSERVWGYAHLIAAELDLCPDDADRLHWAALLHDVGKLGVAPEILNKRGRLTAAEWSKIKTHPEFGARLVAPLASWLGPWAEAVSQHHERFDGTGYPNQLAGEDISLGGRIVAVIDTYDVITSARSYKRPVSSRQARAELRRCAGTQFDPAIVEAFVNISTGRVRFAAGPLAGVAQLPLISSVTQTGVAVGAATTAAGALPAATAVAMGTLISVAPMASASTPPPPASMKTTPIPLASRPSAPLTTLPTHSSAAPIASYDVASLDHYEAVPTSAPIPPSTTTTSTTVAAANRSILARATDESHLVTTPPAWAPGRQPQRFNTPSPSRTTPVVTPRPHGVAPHGPEHSDHGHGATTPAHPDGSLGPGPGPGAKGSTPPGPGHDGHGPPPGRGRQGPPPGHGNAAVPPTPTGRS